MGDIGEFFSFLSQYMRVMRRGFVLRKNPYQKGRFRINGDRSLLVDYGDDIDLTTNRKVKRMAEILSGERLKGVQAIIPSYRNISVVYNPLEISVLELRDQILLLEDRFDQTDASVRRVVEIPVCYGKEFGPDIDFVADYNHIRPDDVILLHTAPLYTVFAVGFTPGFCYLGGLHKRLHTPRLDNPRLTVPAGSVGIAENQTGVYPLETPGGWRLIGRTPLTLFNPDRPDPFLCGIADSIKFVAISVEEFDQIRQSKAP